jgi:hypothetical protein
MRGEGRGLYGNAERGAESADEVQRSAQFLRVSMLRGRPLTPVAAFLVLAMWLASPAARATAGEEMIGTSCSTGNSNIDWDTVGQCNGTVFAHGPFIVGAMTDPPYSATTCTSSNAGMVQYTGGVLEYCNGSSWLPLSSGPGPGVLISTQTASSSASLQFTNLPTSYNTLFLNCADLLASSSSVDILVRVGEGAGPTWESGAHYSIEATFNGGGTSLTNATDITHNNGGSHSTTKPTAYKMYFDSVGSTGVYKMVTYQLSEYVDANGAGLFYIFGSSFWNNDTNAITGIEVVTDTGTITSGTCSLYGMN